MEDMEDTLGHLADANSRETLRHFRGYARIDLSHLTLEEDGVFGSRPLGPNVTRLLSVFESNLCDREDPDHHVPVIISEDVLNQAIHSSGTTQETLLQGIDLPELVFEPETHLQCLRGKSRLTAAREFFPPGNKWWGAKLYLDSLPDSARAHLREKYQNARNFNDGDIYRNFRHHQRQGNTNQEKKWGARWDAPKRKKVERMQKNIQLRDVLDLLLPYVGLWAPVNVKLFRRIVDWRCDEESINYLFNIHQIWSGCFPGDAAALVDANSVLQVEGLMPCYSITDQEHILHLGASGRLFPAVACSSTRERAVQTLLRVPGRILSLHTLSQDLIYLELPARAMRGLLPKSFKRTVRDAMLRRYQSAGDKWCIQTSPHVFKEISPNGSKSRSDMQQAAAILSYIQLWLYTFRQFVVPPRDPQKQTEDAHGITLMRGLPLLADVAQRLGFKSDEIRQLCLRDVNMETSRYLVEHVCEVELYDPSPKAMENAIHRLNRVLEALFQKSYTPGTTPVFSDNNRDSKAQRRFNRPTISELRHDRPHIFLEHIYSSDQPVSRHPTSLAVTREVIFSFFGKKQIYNLLQEANISLDQPGVTEETRSVGEQTSETQPDVADVSERSPVPLEPHPSGSPGRPTDDTQPVPPLAPGFEDSSSGPLAQEINISVHRSAKDILRMWYESASIPLVVLFLFVSRSFYKFTTEQEVSLHSTISSLARDHSFMTFEENRVRSLTDPEIVSELLEKKILLVGAKSCPRNGNLGVMESPSGGISLDVLEKYLSAFDVRTGKRHADRGTDREGDQQRKRARGYEPQREMAGGEMEDEL